MAVNNGEKKAEINLTEFEKVPSISTNKPNNLVYGEGANNWHDGQLNLTIPPRSGFILAE